MATIFWDCEGILLIDLLNLIRRLCGEVEDKRRNKRSSRILLLQDNAPVHKADVSINAICECKFKESDHPPYSSDLSLCNYYLFPKLKKELRGWRFADVSGVTEATKAFLTQ